MANEETEMNFVRCWNCRSLVPSTATRCRMCGSSLSEGQGATGGGQETPPEETGERRSRIRQKTMSISEAAVQSIKASAAASAAPVEERPRRGPESQSQVIGSGFRLGNPPNATQPVAPPVVNREPVSPSLSVTARALRELEEESDHHEIPQGAAAFQESTFERATFEPAASERSALEHWEIPESTDAVGAEVESAEHVAPTAAEDEFDDESEDEGELEGEELEVAVEIPAKKRKRRRRKKKKAGQLPGATMPGATVPDPSNPSVNMGSGDAFATREVQSSQHDYQHASIETGAPVARAALHSTPAHLTPVNTPKQQENQPMQTTSRTDVHHETSRSDATRAANGQPGARQAVASADQNRKRVECPQGGLIGWFINYDKDKGGVATEIRCGRFFICGEKLKDTDLVLEHSSLSTPHCLVKAGSQEGLKIQDLMSENGTFIKRRGESEFRRQHETTSVYHGDTLKFGDYEVMVCLIDFPFVD